MIWIVLLAAVLIGVDYARKDERAGFGDIAIQVLCLLSAYLVFSDILK